MMLEMASKAVLTESCAFASQLASTFFSGAYEWNTLKKRPKSSSKEAHGASKIGYKTINKEGMF